MGDALAAATALLAHNTAYHNHKEQMAYLGAAAYIGAAAALTFSRPAPLHWLVVGLLVATGVAGLLYVAWQLEKRDVAAQSVQHLYNFIIRPLPEPERATLGALPPDTRLPKAVMLLVMVLWTVWAFYEVLHRAGCV
jgi:hypothetical protein